MTKQNKRTALIIYTIVFYTLWTIFEFAVKDKLNSLIPSEMICQLVKSGVIKNLVWTLPAILLVRRFQSEAFVPLKEMFTAKTDPLKYLPILIMFTVYVLAGSILKNGRLAVSDRFGMDKIIIVLFVGLTEETVFRGWLLNVTILGDRKWRYVIINAFMFLAIHFPRWIHEGIFIGELMGFGFFAIMALSVIFGWTFIKSRNLLVPIVLHTYWDLLMFMFY